MASAQAEAPTASPKGNGKDVVDPAATVGSLGGASAEASGTRPKRKKLGAKWDGRVGALTLNEYREKKWSLDACFNNSKRIGPSWTCRPYCQPKPKECVNTILHTDPIKSFNVSQPSGPKFSMAMSSFAVGQDRSPGPIYDIKSAMHPSNHPTLSKHTGPKIGSERLQALDEQSPAPGDYDPDAWKYDGRFNRSASWTCTGREAWAETTKAQGPAPGEYKFFHTTRVGKLTPFKWNMQGKTEPLAKPRGSRRFESPAPTHYNPPGAGAQCDNPRRNTHADKPRPPNYGFGKETRGLV